MFQGYFSQILYKRRPLGAAIIHAVIGSADVRFAGMACGFLLAILLARGLGPEAYGIYGLAMSIVAILVVVADFGATRLVTREVAASLATKDWGLTLAVLRWSRKAALCVSTPVVIASFAWATLDRDSPLARTLAAGILLVPLVVFGNIQGGAIRGLHKVVLSQLPQVLVRPATFSILLFTVTVMGVVLDAPIAMALGVAAMATALVVGNIMLRRTLPDEVKSAIPKPPNREWRSGSLSIVYSDTIRVMQTHALVILLGVFWPPADVGSFRAATSLLALFAPIDTLFTVVSAPYISKLWVERDHLRLQRLLFGIAFWSLIGSAIIVAPFLAWSDHVVTILLGREFGSAARPLVLMCLAFLINTATGPSMVLLNMSGHEKDVGRAATASVLTIGLAGIPMMYLLGAEGAALSYGISLLIANFFMWHTARKKLNLDPSVFSTLLPVKR